MASVGFGLHASSRLSILQAQIFAFSVLTSICHFPTHPSLAASLTACLTAHSLSLNCHLQCKRFSSFQKQMSHSLLLSCDYYGSVLSLGYTKVEFH